jgi:sugar (pentulose or hexulose) kinase
VVDRDCRDMSQLKPPQRKPDLAEGTPVTCGTIDAAAEAVSVGVEARRHDDDVWLDHLHHHGDGQASFPTRACGTRPGCLKASMRRWPGLATSGTLTHWFRDHFAKELSKEEAFAVLPPKAEASPPGAKGLICLPYFSGERTPIHDSNAKRHLLRLDLTHDRGDLYRAVLEGIAMGHAAHCRHLCRSRAGAKTFAGGRRRHQERALASGDVGPYRPRSDRLLGDHRRLLWQRVSGAHWHLAR